MVLEINELSTMDATAQAELVRRRELTPPYFWLGMEASPVKIEDYLRALEWMNEWVRRVARWWTTGLNLLLTPTVWEPPATLASMTPVEDNPHKLGRKVGRHVFSPGRSISRASRRSRCRCIGLLKDSPSEFSSSRRWGVKIS